MDTIQILYKMASLRLRLDGMWYWNGTRSARRLSVVPGNIMWNITTTKVVPIFKIDLELALAYSRRRSRLG
jgi:hypothetical protein